MSKKYPYIQREEKIKDFVCENCKHKVGVGLALEWRVDWFQGNCEFEKSCIPCVEKKYKRNIAQEEREKKEHKEWCKRMEPIWKKERQKRDRADKRIEENKEKLPDMACDWGFPVKIYESTGQWSFGDVLDLWTTTGTAIARKSRNRYKLSFEDINKIRKILESEENNYKSNNT